MVSIPSDQVQTQEERQTFQEQTITGLQMALRASETERQKLSEENDYLRQAYTVLFNWRQWVRDLLRVPSAILSPSHKASLIVLRDDLEGRGDDYAEIKSWELCQQAGQSKGTFLANLSYCVKKLGILRKKRVRHEHKSASGEKKYTTSLYVSTTPMLFLPYCYSTPEDRHHGGERQERKRCPYCQSDDQLDIYHSYYCHNCGQWHHKEVAVAPATFFTKGNLPTENTITVDGQVAYSEEETPEESTQDEEKAPSSLQGEQEEENTHNTVCCVAAEEPAVGATPGLKPLEPAVESVVEEEAQDETEYAIISSNSMSAEQQPSETSQAIVKATLLREQFTRGVLTELQPLPQWVVWGRVGAQKVPYNPTEHYQASSSKPETWGTLHQALSALETGRFAGIGFMLDPKRIPLTFIDLDHCYSREEGRITDPKAADIIKRLNSYTEVSPSGEGLHILAYGNLPGSGIHTDIEMYAQGRYFTVTAHPVPGTPLTIAQRPAEINELYAAHKPKAALTEPKPSGVTERSGPPLFDLPVEAERDPVLQELLRGDLSRYGGDESRADFVLLMKLMHWTGDDVALTKQLYRASPLGQREKVLEKRGPTTYLDMTIRNVLRKRRNQPKIR